MVTSCSVNGPLNCLLNARLHYVMRIAGESAGDWSRSKSGAGLPVGVAVQEDDRVPHQEQEQQTQPATAAGPATADTGNIGIMRGI